MKILLRVVAIEKKENGVSSPKNCYKPQKQQSGKDLNYKTTQSSLNLNHLGAIKLSATLKRY